tara:strand:+ start:4055 stop:4435 length:381 start_codon:yes stop_codon:yes gene_type:complete
MILVENEERYFEFIRELRNHNQVREGFIQQEHIPLCEHLRFMKKYGNLYYICLVQNNPAGFVGQLDGDIRVAVHPDFQGQGVGTFMINELMELHPDAAAKVKLENEASIKLFERCGFKKKYYILER